MEEFIISSVKTAGRGKRLYTLLGKMPLQIYSDIDIKPLEMVKLDSDDISNGRVDVQNLEYKKASIEQYERVLAGIVDTYAKDYETHMFGIEELDAATAAMHDGLSRTANLLKRNFFAGSPVMVRFHNDGDGASGAVALYRSFEKLGSSARIGGSHFMWNMNKGVAYLPEYFESDMLQLSGYAGAEKPIIMIIDFGTTEESVTAIKRSAGKANLVWIDHHPVYEGFPYKEMLDYVNPWLSGYGSDVTAGFLACEVANVVAGLKSVDLMNASLISDHSKYAKASKSGADLALFLDSITMKDAFRGRKITPKTILGIMEDKNLYNGIISSARAELEEAIDIGIRKSKVYVHDNFVIDVLDYRHLIESDYEFVKHGKFTSLIQDSVEKKYGKDAVTMVYNKNLVSMRVTKGFADRVNLLGIISYMKENTEYIENGGGHNEAASIRISYGFDAKEVISAIIKMISDALEPRHD